MTLIVFFGFVFSLRTEPALRDLFWTDKDILSDQNNSLQSDIGRLKGLFFIKKFER
jgi:hypothetical protein